MNRRIVFYVHPNKSGDGDFAPANLIGANDHGTVACYPEAVDPGRQPGVDVISGIELTTLFSGREYQVRAHLRGFGLSRIIKACDLRRSDSSTITRIDPP
jgi:hypothetical protein